jgi:hypothetical protein
MSLSLSSSLSLLLSPSPPHFWATLQWAALLWTETFETVSQNKSFSFKLVSQRWKVDYCTLVQCWIEVVRMSIAKTVILVKMLTSH